ncbi:MAG: DUF4405 domain-containing protein, partial [Coriobacteriia bacterium]
MSKRSRLALDAALLVALLVAFYPAITGISIHEWLSLALIVPALLHLVINWEWVVRSARTLFGRLRAVSKVNFVVDVALFVSTVAVMLSGLLVSQVISSALGARITPSMLWHVVHSLSATSTILLTA